MPDDSHQKSPDRSRIQASAAPRIVSSSHLAIGHGAALSELEFGLIIANNAFNRWAVRCMHACGVKDMTITDVLVLHLVNQGARERKLADIAFILNIEDTHVVNYSLKKLQSQGLTHTRRRGKEVLHSASKRGRALCESFSRNRERVLISGLACDSAEQLAVQELSAFLRTLSDLYDQAARAATSM